MEDQLAEKKQADPAESTVECREDQPVENVEIKEVDDGVQSHAKGCTDDQ